MEGLTAGRIVHYVMDQGRSKGEHRPAIVVRVWPDYFDADSVPLIQLQVFTDQTNDDCQTGTIWRTSVHFDGDAKAPGTWHWIERA